MIRSPHATLATVLLASASTLLTACVPMLVAGAAGVALVATDRRSAGAQLDDQTIETKVATTVATRYGDRAHVNITSFNGIVALTGEAPDPAVRGDVEALARGTDRVRSVHNELVVGPPTNLGARSNDTYITSKVKARFVEANRFAATQVKVVTERGVVYLMGIVTRGEADAASEIASTTSGVVRVVRLFEITG